MCPYHIGSTFKSLSELISMAVGATFVIKMMGFKDDFRYKEEECLEYHNVSLDS